MKRISFCSIFLSFLPFSPLLWALDSGQVTSYSQRISNSDPAVRLGAISELGMLAERNPAQAGNEVVPIFAKGLSDPDAKVRANAAADLQGIAMQTAPRFMQPKPGFPDLRSYGPLKASLEAAMFDSDAEVRRAVWGTYVLTFDIAPEMQAKFIKQFSLEEKTGLQPGIIDLLTSSKARTPDTESFLTHLLDDSKNRPFVVQSFANTPSAWNLPPPPSAALPKLADMLVKEKDTEKRQALVRAVGKYGAQARPYLRQIEQLRDKEADATTRLNLKAAADAVRAGKPLQDQ